MSRRYYNKSLPSNCLSVECISVGGLDAYSDLSAEQRITLLGRREEFYADEFTEHGLDRVAIAATKNKP